MFIRYNGILCLNDWNDVIEIKYDNVIIGFVSTIELEKNEIIYSSGEEKKNILINNGDLILITVAHSGRGISSITEAGIYIQKESGTFLIFGYSIPDLQNDIKNSDSYKMNSYIAERISVYYNIPWEYRNKVDSPEKQKPNKVIKILFIVFLISMILKLVLDFI